MGAPPGSLLWTARVGISAGVGYAVGAERRSPGGRPERSAYRVRAVREGVQFPLFSCVWKELCDAFRAVSGPVDGGRRSLSRSRSAIRYVDDYLEFVGARGAMNTWLAVAYDLKVFFEVVAKEPAEVTAADVFAFLAAQRAPRRGDRVVRIEDGEGGVGGAHDRPAAVERGGPV